MGVKALSYITLRLLCNIVKLLFYVMFPFLFYGCYGCYIIMENIMFSLTLVLLAKPNQSYHNVNGIVHFHKHDMGLI